ncbi:MAG: hypothetical protein RR512_02510 [Coprobacillus sp.]
MLDNRGSTLIESLFALEIFLSVLIVYVSLFQTIFKEEVKMRDTYTEIIEREGDVLLLENFSGLIEMVLR